MNPRSNRKRTGSLVMMSFALIIAMSVLAFASTGNADASTTTGDGAGRLVYLSGDNITVNVSAPTYLGLDVSEWNFTVLGYYAGASADLSIIIWINDGVINDTIFVLENETLADENVTGYISVDPSSYSANASATMMVAAFLDDAGTYLVSGSSDNWTGSVSIEESALLAALNYFMPAMILLAVVGVIFTQIQKVIPR